MIKRLILGGMLAAALTGLPALSLAGDIANIQPLGFSADGKVFGFQEFGLKEEGGVPYSNTYFVDTENGQYLEGTPFRTEMTDKDANLSKARPQNLTAARSQMDKYDLLTNPGLIAAFNPPTELGSPAKTIRYTTLATDGPPKSPYTLSLSEMPVPTPKDCAAIDKRVLGFSLQMIEKQGAPNRQAARQATIVPAERACSVEYRIGGAVVYQPESGNTVHIALILAFDADRNGRWIAVPVHP
ncbi:DUF2259 domain-containing protein [Rhizobium hidalgonense]|uniref:DUF2259 domain-containing protein n=1 Tax=Rhizobium hidalgonense TaxID=1538159 RepID=A0A2A6KL75_9HYPH|nr:DUF2259 domain-containing protein [Rhizobium hidalgonense]MDR9771297.1 DUF2259 domain-containing protein [Rhizobium hidalgonense]MDR9809148.1 DUF2259 domain-containing protein [Rhizobium hidalgonense]MDR9818673.1 DUF2259 domain-containing protein [Rhizobium hidalgonense]PDT25301.1 hypothetical protein CO674_00270 [Rhizobium hidalgonense]PON07434.1 hypothetical protein ATY29_09755 [Rhizobium hidalgonense]